jgi:hypothetical protein
MDEYIFFKLSLGEKFLELYLKTKDLIFDLCKKLDECDKSKQSQEETQDEIITILLKLGPLYDRTHSIINKALVISMNEKKWEGMRKGVLEFKFPDRLNYTLFMGLLEKNKLTYRGDTRKTLINKNNQKKYYDFFHFISRSLGIKSITELLKCDEETKLKFKGASEQIFGTQSFGVSTSSIWNYVKPYSGLAEGKKGYVYSIKPRKFGYDLGRQESEVNYIDIKSSDISEIHQLSYNDDGNSYSQNYKADLIYKSRERIFNQLNFMRNEIIKKNTKDDFFLNLKATNLKEVSEVGQLEYNELGQVFKSTEELYNRPLEEFNKYSGICEPEEIRGKNR